MCVVVNSVCTCDFLCALVNQYLLYSNPAPPSTHTQTYNTHKHSSGISHLCTDLSTQQAKLNCQLAQSQHSRLGSIVSWPNHNIADLGQLVQSFLLVNKIGVRDILVSEKLYVSRRESDPSTSSQCLSFNTRHHPNQQHQNSTHDNTPDSIFKNTQDSTLVSVLANTPDNTPKSTSDSTPDSV